MKKILIAILLFSTIGAFAQCLVVKKVEIYGLSWNVRTPIPITIKTLKQRSHYHLVLKIDTPISLYDLFYIINHSNIINLKTQFPINVIALLGEKRLLPALNCFCNGRIAKIYFRANGEYYYKGKYYKANKELYYCIFPFEKDTVMPDGLIQEGKIIYEENRRRAN